MRCISLIVAAAVLASCTTAPEPETRSPQAQRDLDRLLAGKVAGPPVKCLPSYAGNDMVVIDERTIAYRQGAGRVFLSQMRNPCTGLGNGGTLVTRTYGTPET